MSKKAFVWALVVAFVLSFGTAYAASEGVAETWDVAVGKATADGVSLDAMFPGVVYVHEGDTVTFTNGSMFTPHTVTFLAGAAPLSPEDPKNLAPGATGVKWDGKKLLNSGMMEPGAKYSVTFTASGAYPYYCILHPLMTGTVVVIPKGQPIPTKVQQAAASKAQTDDLIEQADALRHAKHEAQYAHKEDGSFTYKMELGVGHRGFSVNRMLPETLFISEGDTVEWLNDNHYEMHFITFNKPAEESFFLQGGAFNPKFMAPSGGTAFDGTGFTNSGVMMPSQSYKLTFTKAGTYTYECYLHSGDKMTGTIVVAPMDTVKVTVNGKPLAYDYTLPQVHNNHVYVGLDSFAEALGGSAAWDDALGAVILNIGGTYSAPDSLAPASGVPIIVNGKQLVYGFDPQPFIYDGRSFAPVQELVGALGGWYGWDQATRSMEVEVQAGSSSQEPAAAAGAAHGH
ncbi:plastocyanin/azurin family copper-binding protein [Paenibacillus mesophilus]|uniref:plastocyanin/azurin family copper-binding protein n=1 Tax=Paenibacillus mesophilus TaxID=2582849 RepID=UPI00130526C8|nr:plastocyanin/azurin family copper-binding protein [Paenibacillus mesophilus]